MALRRFSAKFTRKKTGNDGETEIDAPTSGPAGIDEDDMENAEQLAQANATDPSVAFVKKAAVWGFSRRRWFVLHRLHHKLAYYAKPFVPPEIGQLKGVIDLVKVTEISSDGRKVELKISKGRKAYRLLADTDKIASDWVKLIKFEAHLAASDNPLNKMVEEMCQSPEEEKEAEELYTEYGGFKFAADEDLSMYTDFDPTLVRGADGGEDEDDGGYLDKGGANDGSLEDADDYVPPSGDAAMADDGYLDQQAGGTADNENKITDDGYLDQQADSVAVDADDYVPPGGASEMTDDGYLDQKAPDDAVAAGADDYDPSADDSPKVSEPMADDGYLDQQAPDDSAAADAEDYVPPSDSGETSEEPPSKDSSADKSSTPDIPDTDHVDDVPQTSENGEQKSTEDAPETA